MRNQLKWQIRQQLETDFIEYLNNLVGTRWQEFLAESAKRKHDPYKVLAGLLMILVDKAVKDDAEEN